MEERSETAEPPENEGMVEVHAITLSYSMATILHQTSLQPWQKQTKGSYKTYLTGHCELNYHLDKYKPQSISKICPHFEKMSPLLNGGGNYEPLHRTMSDVVQ